ncbi:hypothetical protein [Deinococcus gobiensis]|uniref:hypothetical protein n=1 Tax=Deinococcus gobiensis TaxID=502394 RepID=UPI0005C13310|nr:hypothetical protein [Deinococcus gobiensis]
MLRFAREGLVQLRPPHREDHPFDYLARQYVEAHHETFNAPDVHMEVGCLSLSARPEGGLSLMVWPRRGRVLSLHRLRADLGRVHPALFGAVMERLHQALSPYAPIFTAKDAYLGFLELHYGDMWHEDALEDLNEASHVELQPSERDLWRWAERQGRWSPGEVGRMFPRPLFKGHPRHLELLRLPEVQRLQGIPTLCALLDHLPMLPKSIMQGRIWYEERRLIHPGAVDIVICQRDQGHDPVLEFYNELGDYVANDSYGEMEHLQAFSVTDTASHARAMEYFEVTADMQRRVQEMWDALVD